MNYPFVSILIPVYNEEKKIASCINNLLSQDYPQDKFEILLADGNSIDKTIDIIKNFTSLNKNIRLFQNPSRNTAIGRNICLSKAKGEIVINYSGHVTAKKDFIRTLAQRLINSDDLTAAVGCSNISPKNQSFTGRCIDVVFGSIFGGVRSMEQNKKHTNEKYAESIAFSAYKKDLLLKIGRFDSRFWVGQDAELNLRLKKKGYKIIYTPKTFVFHYKRDGVRKFLKQMYRYGIARSMMIQKHPDTFKLIYLIPSFFVFLFLTGFVLTLTNIKILSFFVLGILIYSALGIFFSSLNLKELLPVLLSPFFYFLEHFGYGFGFLRGLFFNGFR